MISLLATNSFSSSDTLCFYTGYPFTIKLHLLTLYRAGPRIRRFYIKKKKEFSANLGWKGSGQNSGDNWLFCTRTLVCQTWDKYCMRSTLFLQQFSRRVDTSQFVIRTCLLLPHAVTWSQVSGAELCEPLPKEVRETHLHCIRKLSTNLLLSYGEKHWDSLRIYLGTCKRTILISFKKKLDVVIMF